VRSSARYLRRHPVLSHWLFAFQRCLQLARQEKHQPAAGYTAPAAPIRDWTVSEMPKVVHPLNTNAEHILEAGSSPEICFEVRRQGFEPRTR
jgi:hypothetical protein